MPKLPDYREIETCVSISNIKDQVASLLYAAGLVHDNEEVIDVEFDFEGRSEAVIPLKIKIKKQQTVELIEH